MQLDPTAIATLLSDWPEEKKLPEKTKRNSTKEKEPASYQLAIKFLKTWEDVQRLTPHFQKLKAMRWKKSKKDSKGIVTVDWICANCFCDKTPLKRIGPDDISLCNKCGIRFSRNIKYPEYHQLPLPPVIPHKRKVEMEPLPTKKAKAPKNDPAYQARRH